MRFRLLIVSTLLLSAAAMAQNLGNITSVKGRVSIIPAGESAKPVSANMPVREGDTLVTQSDSEAVITLSTGSVLKVGAETRMKINKNAVNPGSGSAFSVGLTSGSLSAKVSKLKTTSDSFNVYTPTSVAGVRGTDFSVAAGIDGSSQLQVAEGEVEYGRGPAKTSVKTKQKAEVDLSDSAPKAESGSDDIGKWVAKRDKKAKENPEKTLGDMQSYIDRTSSNAANSARTVEASSTDDSAITNKADYSNQLRSALSANETLQFNRTVAEGILANARTVAGDSPSAKAKEALSGVERIGKAFDDANKRIEAALARLDARLEAARKRIDDSWKGASSRIDKSMGDDRFKSFDEKYNRSKTNK